MNRSTLEMLNRLQRMGITLDDALGLRRVSMTLQRWHELECNGDVIRLDDDKTYSQKVKWAQGILTRIADREKGALRRLDTIMARYPDLAAYVQTDPRGAALYLYRKDNEQLKTAKYGIVSVYSSVGVAVHK